METLLTLNGIDKSFSGVQALQGAGLTVYAGQVMALMGENGAGKSTLTKILTGIYQRDAGSIEYLGKSVHFANPKASQEAGVSIIHQELNILSNLSIAENIFLGREFTHAWGGIDWNKMYLEADKLLARLGIKHSSKQLVGELSIGERQMVEIAKALSFESQVIVMDEPTDALSDTETEALFAVIRELKAQGRGIVYISHRLQEIFQICDYVTVLRDGQWIGECAVADLNETQLIEMMVGRSLEEQYPHLEQERGAICLEIKELSGCGVQKASLTVHHGEILGVSGLMGAGRSELMKLIYGALPRSSGEIWLNGKRIKPKTPAQGLACGIVYISEDRKGDGLVLSMSVKENMSLSSLKRFERWGKIIKHNELLNVQDFVDWFAIKTPSVDKIIAELSGGNQQKVAIAKGLMCRPQVLILDEPTRGVDVGAKKEIYQLINRFKAEGLSVILVSSDMPEVLGMSDRIIVMKEGSVMSEFSRTEASQEKLLAAALGRQDASHPILAQTAQHQ